jgi:hypothetical protein
LPWICFYGTCPCSGPPATSRLVAAAKSDKGTGENMWGASFPSDASRAARPTHNGSGEGTVAPALTDALTA